jgi:hypothetical protein
MPDASAFLCSDGVASDGVIEQGERSPIALVYRSAASPGIVKYMEDLGFQDGGRRRRGGGPEPTECECGLAVM